MDIAVLGTGMVGRTIAGRLQGLGHTVVVGTRDPQATLARTDPDAMGNPPFAAWLSDNPGIDVATFVEAAARATVVVNATAGAAALAVLESAGSDNLAGKPLLDISNPLDFSAGMPPTLLIKDTDSLGEQIQRAFPEALVVKTLNTLTAPLMVHPDSLGQSSTIFVSGNDSSAKATALELLQSFGHEDVIDLGGIETARGTEMMLPVWLRLMSALGTPMFNFKVIR